MEQHWALYILLLIAMVISLGLTILQLPGLWLMLLFAIGYAWVTDSAHIGIVVLGGLFLLAAIAEVLESLAAAGGAARAGSTKTAMVFAILGAFIGGVSMTFLLPVPVIGTLVGVVLGAFAGAYVGDQMRGRSHEQAIRSGMGAAVGRLVGTAIKLVFGVAMLIITAIAAIPMPSRAPAITPAPAPVQTTPAQPAPAAPAAPAPQQPLDVER